MVKPTDPISPRDKAERKKLQPDTETFQEYMKIDKVKETELDEERKKRYRPPEEEETAETLSTKQQVKRAITAPTDVSFKTDQVSTNKIPENTTIVSFPSEDSDQTNVNVEKNDLPSNPNFYDQVSTTDVKEKKDQTKKPITQTRKEEKENAKPNIKGKVYKGLKRKEKTENIQIAKPKISKEQLVREIEDPFSKEKMQKTKDKAKNLKYLHDESMQLPETKTKSSSKKEEKEKLTTSLYKEQYAEKEKTSPKDSSFHEKDQKQKSSHEEQLPYVKLPATIPNELQTQSVQSTQGYTFTSPDVNLLFQHMVGRILQLNLKGVCITEVTLNSPSFANSKFYQAKIILEKYSTAPNSFNVRLTGSNEAVALFSDNIEGLRNAFNNKKFGFEIERLEAEYQSRPLFKRKKAAGDSNKESDGQETP
jgi:hypothetical protein